MVRGGKGEGREGRGEGRGRGGEGRGGVGQCTAHGYCCRRRPFLSSPCLTQFNFPHFCTHTLSPPSSPGLGWRVLLPRLHLWPDHWGPLLHPRPFLLRGLPPCLPAPGSLCLPHGYSRHCHHCCPVQGDTSCRAKGTPPHKHTHIAYDDVMLTPPLLCRLRPSVGGCGTPSTSSTLCHCLGSGPSPRSASQVCV